MVAPIISSSVLAVCIDCTSNVIAQSLTAWKEDVPFVFNRGLFVRFAIYASIMAPINFLWQSWLERAFPGWKIGARKRRQPAIPLASMGATHQDGDLEEQAGKADNGERHVGLEDEAEEGVRMRDWTNIGKKWFADCITFGALFNTVAFLVILGFLKGKSVGEVSTDLRNETISIIVNSWKIWPIANFISTTYVPVERRIIFLSFCGLIWNVYMSLVAARL